MGYEHIREVLFFLKLLKQVDDLRLDRHVKRRHAFVADNELRVHRKCTRDRDTLSLTARELVRVTVEHIILKAALAHYVENVLFHQRRAVLVHLMCHKTFLDDLTDGHTRVERGVRILEDYLQILAQVAHLGIFETCKVDTVVEHRLIAHKLRVVRVRLFELCDLTVKLCDLAVLHVTLTCELIALRNETCALLCSLCRIFFVICGVDVGNLKVDVADLIRQCRCRILNKSLLVEERSARIGIGNHKAAEDLGYMSLYRLILGYGKVLFLKIEEARVIAQLISLFGECVGMSLRRMKLGYILVDVLERVKHIFGRDLGARNTVIDRCSGSLIVKLKQDSAERGFSAARLADDTYRLSLIDVKGNILVRSDVKLFFLEYARLCDREIFFKIRD